MPAPLYNADNVVVGNAILRLAPWVLGDVEPLVADSVPLFSEADLDWPAPWFSAGATDEGFQITTDTSTTTVTIEEQSTPVGEAVEAKTISIVGALAEDTLQTIGLAWGGSTIVTTAPSPTLPGTQKMTLSDDRKYYVGVLEMANKFGLARRIYIPKLSGVGSGDTSFRRAAAKRLYPMTFTSLCRPNEIQVVEITAPKTA